MQEGKNRKSNCIGEYKPISDSAKDQGANSLATGPYHQVAQVPYIAIEYPGYIKNVDNALNSLGGPLGIAKVMSQMTLKISLSIK
jgi:hypothetical protein